MGEGVGTRTGEAVIDGAWYGSYRGMKAMVGEKGDEDMVGD